MAKKTKKQLDYLDFADFLYSNFFVTDFEMDYLVDAALMKQFKLFDKMVEENVKPRLNQKFGERAKTMLGVNAFAARYEK